jgi:hypothetical protein
METNTNTTTPAPIIFESPFEMAQQRADRQFNELQKQLAESDGTVQSVALFDLEGNWTPAKIVEGKFGFSWLVLDENGKGTGVFIPYASKKRDTQAKRGFVEGTVRVPATVVLAGGFRPTAHIVPAGAVGTVKPTTIITTDRFKKEEGK